MCEQSHCRGIQSAAAVGPNSVQQVLGRNHAGADRGGVLSRLAEHTPLARRRNAGFREEGSRCESTDVAVRASPLEQGRRRARGEVGAEVGGIPQRLQLSTYQDFMVDV